MGTKLHGLNAVVYMAPGTGVAVEISEAAEWSIDIDFDTDAAYAFGETWETVFKGINRWSGSLSGNYDTAAVTCFSAAISATASNMYLYPSKTASTQYYYGTVWPKLSITVPASGHATFSGSFQGESALSKN